jgi:hypothetical protein
MQAASTTVGRVFLVGALVLGLGLFVWSRLKARNETESAPEP